MWRIRPILLALMMAPSVLSCHGSAARGPAEPSAGGAGQAGEQEPECCCQRYDEKGNATGAATADESTCKSTGGTCTEDLSQCSDE
jgi:hypothetical protein